MIIIVKHGTEMRITYTILMLKKRSLETKFQNFTASYSKFTAIVYTYKKTTGLHKMTHKIPNMHIINIVQVSLEGFN